MACCSGRACNRVVSGCWCSRLAAAVGIVLHASSCQPTQVSSRGLAVQGLCTSGTGPSKAAVQFCDHDLRSAVQVCILTDRALSLHLLSAAAAAAAGRWLPMSLSCRRASGSLSYTKAVPCHQQGFDSLTSIVLAQCLRCSVAPL
jgi:hypothetical protein